MLIAYALKSQKKIRTKKWPAKLHCQKNTRIQSMKDNEKEQIPWNHRRDWLRKGLSSLFKKKPRIKKEKKTFPSQYKPPISWRSSTLSNLPLLQLLIFNVYFCNREESGEKAERWWELASDRGDLYKRNKRKGEKYAFIATVSTLLG